MQIEVAITHEVYIDGDKTWVKLGISHEFPNEANIDSAVEVLSDKVNSKLIEVIAQTVQTVRENTN